jgi:hypothetical protein
MGLKDLFDGSIATEILVQVFTDLDHQDALNLSATCSQARQVWTQNSVQILSGIWKCKVPAFRQALIAVC